MCLNVYSELQNKKATERERERTEEKVNVT